MFTPINLLLLSFLGFQLLLNRVKELGNIMSKDSLLQWLDHGKLGVRKLSLRGLSSLIFESDLVSHPRKTGIIKM